MNAEYYSSCYNMIILTLCDHFNIHIIFYYCYLSKSFNFDSSRYIDIFRTIVYTIIYILTILILRNPFSTIFRFAFVICIV